MNKQMYRYIVEAELTFMMNYRMNPYELFGRLSVSDLQFYLDQMRQRIEERSRKSSGKDAGNAFMMMRDILNGM